MCAAIIALCVVGAGLFPAQPVAGHEVKTHAGMNRSQDAQAQSAAGQKPDSTTLYGASAIEQLKQDGQYHEFQMALNSLQQKLVIEDGKYSDEFGSAVAVDGDTVVVGARSEDFGTNENQGAVYIFTRSGGVWTQQQKLMATDGAMYDVFGWAVAISGDTVAIGAPGNTDTITDQGSV